MAIYPLRSTAIALSVTLLFSPGMHPGSSWSTCIAQEAADAASNRAAEQRPIPLATEQKGVAERFSRLESLLLRSADLEAAENPTRAALLQQAVQLSKQAQLSEMLADAASRLEQGQFSEAIEQQKTSRESLKRLLELLQSENREERIREQRDEVRRWIEETDRLLRLQSSLRGRTEGGQDSERSAADQGKLSDKASDIVQQLGGESGGESQETEAKDASSNKEEGESDSQSNPDEKRPTEPGEPSESKGKSGEERSPQQEPEEKPDGAKSGSGDENSQGKQSPAQPGQEEQDPNQSESKPSEGQKDEGQQSEGQQSEGQPSPEGQSQQQQGQPQQQSQPGDQPMQQPPQSPTERAKQRIEEAQRKMDEAREKLEDAEREGAIEKQREAEDHLREAIEELEEILRQLREEEVERSLASLEMRLRRMLEMQSKVYDETKRLQEISGDQATRQVQIMSSKLALEQRRILAEGERAYLLLREEGSSAAFPEAIEQLNTDIAGVAERLAGGDVGTLTLAIEEEIVRSLEEMVEALVQVQKENREKQQQQGQPQQQAQPGDQPLVDKLAELRLIRTLQVRINNRTGSLSKLLADPADAIGQAQEIDILGQLQGLAQRQASIQRVTRDIVVGKGE